VKLNFEKKNNSENSNKVENKEEPDNHNKDKNDDSYKRFTTKILDEHIKKKRKRVLLNAIKYLSLNNITVEEYLAKKIFPSKPYELRGSEDFFDAVKFNNIDLVKQGLKRNMDYLNQYDYFLQTPFHWAAKLGYYDLLKVLLEHSKMINIYDRELRTPLYLAALNNHKKCVELLLEKGANAYLNDKNGEMADSITTDNSIKQLLQSSPDKPFVEINEINKRKDKKEEKEIAEVIIQDKKI
jgi:ankyrin repeat protein